MTTLEEAIAVFSEFAETGGHREYLGHLDSRLDPHLEILLEAAKKQLAPKPAAAAIAHEEARKSLCLLSDSHFSEHNFTEDQLIDAVRNVARYINEQEAAAIQRGDGQTLPWVDGSVAKTWPEGIVVVYRRSEELPDTRSTHLCEYFRPDWVDNGRSYPKKAQYLRLDAASTPPAAKPNETSGATPMGAWHEVD